MWAHDSTSPQLCSQGKPPLMCFSGSPAVLHYTCTRDSCSCSWMLADGPSVEYLMQQWASRPGAGLSHTKGLVAGARPSELAAAVRAQGRQSQQEQGHQPWTHLHIQVPWRPPNIPDEAMGGTVQVSKTCRQICMALPNCSSHWQCP